MEYLTGRRTLYEAIFTYNKAYFDILFMLAGVVFLSLCANLQIPLWPVPITMQTFGVLFIAFFFGSIRGTATILLYILTGLLGFGVFASHKSGLTVIFGPTIGYIVGFVFCVFIVGKMIESGFGRSRLSIFSCMLIGNSIIYFFGLIGLWYYFPSFGLMHIFEVGLFPFLIGDCLKIVAIIAFVPNLWKISNATNKKSQL